ncbi:hypothetical protein AALO_G00072920 [Alosa alosa]|uniref:Myb/SANT-like DNA-binding domain-containing protein n=1 Tax=Alosa alosa TaxID=278164 RepID=A0AAV6H2D5_9TELE|nr:uncharacterized protein LOC125294282 [Alosa alosa]KAG5281498.1 hypothetical protein AALO_G00072920 [Alosa alosa]
MANLVEAGELHSLGSCQENTDATLSQSQPPVPTFSQSQPPVLTFSQSTFSQSEPPVPSLSQSEPPVPMPPNESFTESQTVFLIDLMRHHIFNEGEGLPKTLHELNTRLKSAKGSKKLLWEDAAEQLSSHFTESFLPRRVCRKWNTLLDGYTRARYSVRNMGKDTRFQFYSEMDTLLEDLKEEEHDVIFPVVITPDGQGLRLPPPQASRSSSVKASPHRRSTPYTPPLRAHYSTPFLQASPIVQVKENESFSRAQTLFLIDLMRQHVITEGEGLPKTLEEMNGRLESATADKKRLWEDIANQMSSHFLEYFYPDKVATKWSSLVQGYKNVRDRDRLTGQRNSMHFQFYSDMDELLEGHNEALPVVVVTDWQGEPKSEALEPSSNDTAVVNNNTTTGSCQESTDATFNQENTDATLSQSEPPKPTFGQSDPPVPTFNQSESLLSLETKKSFTRDQTLFLIDLMRQHIENKGGGPPRTFKELKRLTAIKGSKQQLWKDAAEKLSVHFRKYFCPRRVSRRWTTLVDGYTKVRENMRTRGLHSTCFHFYSEMDALLVEEEFFPVVMSRKRREAVRPVLQGRRSRVRAFTDTTDDPSPPGTPTPPSYKRRRQEDELLHFLREAEKATQRRHNETLTHLKFLREAEKATQRRHNETLTHLKSIQSLMSKLLDKL